MSATLSAVDAVPAGSVGLSPPEWVEDAACKDLSFEEADAYFFPKGPRELCRRCPVRAECLEQALSEPEEHGIWGGFSPRERLRNRTAL
jgi:WhiB family redox-sensing transcriptional regulator